jgi:hypothetical protein
MSTPTNEVIRSGNAWRWSEVDPIEGQATVVLVAVLVVGPLVAGPAVAGLVVLLDSVVATGLDVDVALLVGAEVVDDVDTALLVGADVELPDVVVADWLLPHAASKPPANTTANTRFTVIVPPTTVCGGDVRRHRVEGPTRGKC